MIKRRTLIIVALSLLIAISAPVAGVYWVCYTESGLRWLATQVTQVGSVRIRIDGVQGRLAGPLSVTRLEVDQERAHIVVSDIRADVYLRDVLLQTIHADYLEIGNVEISLKPRSRPARKRAPRFLPRWLRGQADSVSIGAARLVLQNGRVFNATGIRLEPRITTDTLSFVRAVLVSEQIELKGTGIIAAREPLRLAGDIDWIYRPADQPQWAGRVRLDGDLDRLEANGRVAEPFSADVTGVLSELRREWRWDANASSNDFSLQPWSPKSNVRVRSATLSGSGSRGGFRLGGTLVPVTPETGPLDVSFSGGFADRTLRADELRVALKSGKARLEASGTARFAGEATAFELSGAWRDLQWPLTSAAVVQSPRGEFRLGGQLPYRYVASGELELPKSKSPPVSFSSAGELDRQSIRFERLVAQTFGGEVHADGEWRWKDANAWRVNAQARGVNPAKVDERFSSRLNFGLAANGVGFGRKARWSAELRDLEGELRSQPVSGRARVSHENGTYRVASADVRFGSARLEASGQYGGQHDLSWQLSVPDASQLLPDARGSLFSRGRLSGNEAEPRVAASLNAQALAFLNYRLGRLEAEADVDLADRRTSRLQVSGAKLELGRRRINSAEIVLDGRASAHQLSILADSDDASLALRTQSGYEAGVWRGEILELDAGIGTTALKLTAPAHYAVSKERIELEQLCLAGTSERACTRGEWRRAGPWNLDVDASGIPLKVLAAGSVRQTEYSGVLALQATAQQEPGQPWVGKAGATFADGVFRYRRANGELQAVQIGSGRASFDATPQRFSSEVHLDATEAASLNARGSADRTAASDWKKLPLSGALHAETRELGFVPLLVPEIDRAAGKLKADLELGGTVGIPEIEGSLGLDEGELDLYTVNLQMREIGLRLDLEGTGLTLAGKARAGKGIAELSGSLEWRDRQPFGQIKLKGENLELVNVPEARVHVSPDLRFRIDGRRIGVDGAVRVPHAFLTPADLSGAVLASSDEVIVGPETQADKEGFEVTIGVQLVLGKDVHVDSFGLQARVEGNIAAYVAPEEVSTATGELRIAEGKYSAYTRELDIERGRLIFTGGPVSDPGVDLRASREFPEALVGVNVRGTLRNPRLSFWSEPSLPQTQIASLIVAGGHLESFQNRNGTNNRGGGDALLAQGSALLASRLGEQLGLNLEEVRLESDVNDQTRLVLGRYLSPRFYVSYGISLTETINTLKLRYTINDRWTISSEAGEHRGADLEFKIER